MNRAEVEFSVMERPTTIREIDESLFNSINDDVGGDPIKNMEQSISRVVDTVKEILSPHTVAFCWYIPLKKQFRVFSASNNGEHPISKDYIPLGTNDILSETVLRQKTIFCPYVNQKSLPSFTPYYSKSCPVRSIISVPIIYKNSIRAVLLVDSLSTDYFNTDNAKLLWHFASLCSSIMSIYLLRSEEKSSINFSHSAPEYFHNLYTHSDDLDLCLNHFIKGIKKWIKFETLTIGILNSRSELVIHRSSHFNDSPFLKVGKNIDLENSALGNLFLNNISGAIDKLSLLGDQPRFYKGEPKNPYPNASAAVVSFSVNGSNLGIVFVEHRESLFFNDEIFSKVRFFTETLAIALQSIYQKSIISSLEKARSTAQHIPKIMPLDTFTLYLEKEINRSVREKASLGIVIIGIDNGSDIETLYGKDKYIAAIDNLGNIIASKTRSYDICGSLSNGAFIVSLYNTHQIALQLWIESINAQISNFSLPHGKVDHFNITVSIGASVFNGNETKTVSELISDIQSAFQAAKASGGNKTKFLT